MPGGKAVGDLYLDDGHTYDHKNKGAFARRRFEWSGNTLTSKEAPAPYGTTKADALDGLAASGVVLVGRPLEHLAGQREVAPTRTREQVAVKGALGEVALHWERAAAP